MLPSITQKTPKQIPFQRDNESDVPKRPNHIIGLMIAGPWRRLTEILIPYRFGLSLGVFFCRRKWFLKVESGFLTFDKPGWYWFYPKSNFVGENQQTISSLNARQTCNQFFNMSPARNLTFKHDWTKLNGGRMAIISKSWSASPSFLFAGGFLVAQFVRMLRLQKCQLRNFIACFNFVFSCFLLLHFEEIPINC